MSIEEFRLREHPVRTVVGYVQLRSQKLAFVDLNRDELIKRATRANYTGLDHLWLPRTVLASDFVVSLPKIKTHHWAGIPSALKNMFGIVLGTKYGWRISASVRP